MAQDESVKIHLHGLYGFVCSRCMLGSCQLCVTGSLDSIAQTGRCLSALVLLIFRSVGSMTTDDRNTLFSLIMHIPSDANGPHDEEAFERLIRWVDGERDVCGDCGDSLLDYPGYGQNKCSTPEVHACSWEIV